MLVNAFVENWNGSLWYSSLLTISNPIIIDCLEWKSNEEVRPTQESVELWSMIQNGLLDNPEYLSVWGEFDALVALLRLEVITPEFLL